ncbi:MAG TPA: hypothetical protein DD377_04095 [Firmicutes bacterium]|nr:hypothetical protein [Bacillota bacterium]
MCFLARKQLFLYYRKLSDFFELLWLKDHEKESHTRTKRKKRLKENGHFAALKPIEAKRM